jgi:hypothetical protein
MRAVIPPTALLAVNGGPRAAQTLRCVAPGVLGVGCRGCYGALRPARGPSLALDSDLNRKLLPAPTALSEPERIVLWATRSFKAGYAGDPENRYHEARRETGITRDDWTRGKAMAIEKGLLDKRGAITVAGRNAIADIGYCGYPKPAAQPAAPALACEV